VEECYKYNEQFLGCMNEQNYMLKLQLINLSYYRDAEMTKNLMSKNSSTGTECTKKKIYDLKLFKKFRVLLKAGQRPSGPRPDATVFCPAVNPHACRDLHRIWACKMDDGGFEFVYHFNIHFNPF